MRKVPLVDHFLSLHNSITHSHSNPLMRPLPEPSFPPPSRNHSRSDSTLLSPSPISSLESDEDFYIGGSHATPLRDSFLQTPFYHGYQVHRTQVPKRTLTVPAVTVPGDMHTVKLDFPVDLTLLRSQEKEIIPVDHPHHHHEDRPRKPRACFWPMSRRPQRMCLWTFVITVIVVLAVSFLIFFMVAPTIIVQMLENSSNVSRYAISDVRADRLSLRLLHHLDVFLPFEVAVDRFTLTYSNMGRDFGFVAVDGFVIPTWSAKDLDSTNDFVVTDPQAIQQFGHDLLDSMTTGTRRDFLVAAHGDLTLRLGVLKWVVQYNRRIPFFLGGGGDGGGGQPDDNHGGISITSVSSRKLPVVELDKWNLIPDLSVMLSLAVNNTGHVAIDLGAVQMAMNVDQNQVCTVTVPDATVAFGGSLVDAKVSLANVGETLLVYLRLLGDARRTVNVTLQNLELVPSGGGGGGANNQSTPPPPWLAGWFQGVAWTVPVTKATLASIL